MATSIEKRGKELGLSKQDVAQALDQGIGLGDFAEEQAIQTGRDESIANITTKDFSFGDLADPSSNPFAVDPEILQQVRERSDEVMTTITDAMAQVSGLANEAAVDVDALTGKLNESFETTKNMMMNAAMASASKASFELDSFLGTQGSDARSAVRRGIRNIIE